MMRRVVPGMADSTGSRLELEAAMGSKLREVTELISCMSALHAGRVHSVNDGSFQGLRTYVDEKMTHGCR